MNKSFVLEINIIDGVETHTIKTNPAVSIGGFVNFDDMYGFCVTSRIHSFVINSVTVNIVLHIYT